MAAKLGHYEAPSDHAVLIDVPGQPYITIDGRGSPHGPAFQGGIRTLYAVAHGVRDLLKKGTKRPEPADPPLEALWWWADANGSDAPKVKEWRWRLMVSQPAEAKASLVQQAIANARSAHPELALDLVELRHYAEGPSMQILHVGPYRSEMPTIQHLHDDMTQAGYEPAGMHHEIYLEDPRTAKPETLRTLLRQPVRPAIRKETSP